MYFSGLLTIPERSSFRFYEQRKFDTQFDQSLDIRVEMVIVVLVFFLNKKGGFCYKHFSVKQLCR